MLIKSEARFQQQVAPITHFNVNSPYAYYKNAVLFFNQPLAFAAGIIALNLCLKDDTTWRFYSPRERVIVALRFNARGLYTDFFNENIAGSAYLGMYQNKKWTSPRVRSMLVGVG